MKDQLLYEKILSFDIDGQPVQNGFSQRLARDNHWNLEYAERVVLEYRRFVYLAMTAPQVCVPSDAVDQAWHLHLTDSRSYWDRFVPEALGTPLHHEPNKGGVGDDRKHLDLYGETMKVYRSEFGEPPPPDIWPPVEQRFPSPAAIVSATPIADPKEQFLSILVLVCLIATVAGFVIHSIGLFLGSFICLGVIGALSQRKERLRGQLGSATSSSDGADFDTGSGESGGFHLGHHEGGSGGHSGHGGHGCGGHGCGGHGCGGHG